jgi:hypothetical protein
MVQRRKHLGFTLESGHPNQIAREVLRQHLNGYFAIELRVRCPIDFAHPACAQPGGDAIHADGLAEWAKAKRGSLEMAPSSSAIAF